MIRDTSQQDAVLTAAPVHKIKRRALWVGGLVAVAAVTAAVLGAWSSSEHSVNEARLRIAEVSRGTLVRDASVNGRIVRTAS